MEKLKLDINVGGNLQGLEQLINKMKKAEAQMARLAELGKEDKLTSLISGIFGANIGGIGGAVGGFLGGPMGAVIGSTVQKIGAVIGSIVHKVVVTIGDLIISTAKGLGSIALDFGKRVVDSAAYRQSSVLALAKLTGSEAEGTKQFDLATRIADKTIFDTKDIVDLTKRLYLAGFKEKEVDTLRGRALDIASLNGDEGKETLKDYTAAINKIAGKGHYESKIEGLDLIEKRLGNKSVRLGIAEQFGLKGSEKSLLNQVNNLIRAGKVDDTMAINAINEAIAKKTGGGVAGAFSREAATRSISGALSNLQDVFSNTLLRIDWDKSPGIMAFKKFIINLSEVLGSKEFSGLVNDLAEAIFGGFDQINKQDIINWFSKLEGAVVQLIPVIKDLWSDILKFIQGKDSLIESIIKAFADIALPIANIMYGAFVDAVAPKFANKLLGSSLDRALNDYREEVATRREARIQQEWLDREDKSDKAKANVAAGRASFVELEDRSEGFSMVNPVVNNTYNIQVDGTGNKDAGKQVIAAVKNEGLASGRIGKPKRTDK